MSELYIFIIICLLCVLAVSILFLFLYKKMVQEYEEEIENVNRINNQLFQDMQNDYEAAQKHLEFLIESINQK